MIIRESVKVGDRTITLETGRIAKQASGAVLVSSGETVVLVTATGSQEPRPGISFLPLTVDYVEKTYAAGKVPGGFFKREGRLREHEILTSRLIDRPCRPLFPKGYRNEVQIIATVLSVDKQHPSDILALTGASAALHISPIPWEGPIAGVRVARVEGRFVANPTYEEVERADCDILMAASKDAIVMVEGGAKEIVEADLLDALQFGHRAVQDLLDLIEQMREAVGKPKWAFTPPTRDSKVDERVAELARAEVEAACNEPVKQERYGAFKRIKKQLLEAAEAEAMEPADVGEAFEDLKYRTMRAQILEQRRRIDGRDFETVRPIRIEVGWLPRTHGSALFTRGETQAIVTATLGTSQDEQKLDLLIGEFWKRFLLHYNFPPFSVGETRPLRGPGRREIGHGALAERALLPVIPSEEAFPYTIRIVSEITESNGSSSMATVCGASLSLMDAGVPISAPVAGVAMGLVKEGDRYAVLTDILGDEDHLGDMDFKVCGTRKGVTAIQMDIKIDGLSRELLTEALEQARRARMHILDKMAEAIAAPREELSRHAPRIVAIKVKPDQIRSIIGPGGKMIRAIIDQTGCAINVEDDGTVHVASPDQDAVQKAIEIIRSLTMEPEVGQKYKGVVRRVEPYGAFIEIAPGNDGLLHISDFDWVHVERVEDVMKLGDEVEVVVSNIDRDGRIRLSRKELLPKPEGWDEEAEARRAAERRDRRGGRDRDRRGGRDRRSGRDRDARGRGRSERGEARARRHEEEDASSQERALPAEDSSAERSLSEEGREGEERPRRRRRRRRRRRTEEGAASASTEGARGEAGQPTAPQGVGSSEGPLVPPVSQPE